MDSDRPISGPSTALQRQAAAGDWLRSTARLWGRAPRTPLAVVLVLLATAILGDFINGTILHDPYEVNLMLRNRPPWPLEGWDPSRLLGSDALGRDILSRLVLGVRFSLMIAAGSIAIGGLIGMSGGLISGYVGGWFDGVVMRIVDVIIAFPVVLVALVLVTAVGGSVWLVVIILAIGVAAQFARIIRADVSSWRNRDFVSLAVVAGGSPVYIIWRHVLPNVAGTALVVATLQIGWVILGEATLSFLGAGVPAPTPTWGNMVADGTNYLTNQWWISVLPGIAIAMTVMSFNLLGDWVRDVFDPQLSEI